MPAFNQTIDFIPQSQDASSGFLSFLATEQIDDVIIFNLFGKTSGKNL